MATTTTSAIAYCDEAPQIEERGEGFTVTLRSGGDEIAYFLPGFVFRAFTFQGMAAIRALDEKRHGAPEPTPFQLRKQEGR